MAGWGTRFVLLCVICCFLVNVCEARGGRGGGRGGRGYRGGGVGGGSLSFGGGGVSSGLIVGIVVGLISLITVVIILYTVCKACCVCTDTSANKYRGPNGSTVIIRPSSIISTSSQPPGIATPTTSRPRRMVSTPWTTSNEALYNDDNHTSNADVPPSYESVVNQKEDPPSYSGLRNENRSYPPASSRFPAESSGLSYPSRSPSAVSYSPRSPSELPYPSNSSPDIGFTVDGVNGSRDRDVRMLTASGSSRGQGNVSFPASAAGIYV